MRKSRLGIAGLALVAACASLIPASVAHAGTHSGGSGAMPAETNGCVHGAVCMYTDSGWSTGSPEHSWTTYGCYNLDDETGDRVVFNNQTDGDSATLYGGANCAGTSQNVGAGTNWQGDITPVNSVSVNDN